MKDLAQKLAERAKTAMMDPNMSGAMPMDMGMGGQPAMPPDAAMMGAGAPAPSAEEIMAAQGGGGMMPGMEAGMAPMAPPLPPEPPVDEGPDEVQLAQSEALAEMSKAVNNITEALVANQATLTETMAGASEAMMDTPVADLTPEEIEPMIGSPEF